MAAAAANNTSVGLDVLIACHQRLKHDNLIISKSNELFKQSKNNSDENSFVMVNDDTIELTNENSILDKKILSDYNIKSIDYFDIETTKDIEGKDITKTRNGESGQYKSLHYDKKKYDKIFTIFCPIYDFLKLLEIWDEQFILSFASMRERDIASWGLSHTF
jgi:hypothetical protein